MLTIRSKFGPSFGSGKYVLKYLIRFWTVLVWSGLRDVFRRNHIFKITNQIFVVATERVVIVHLLLSPFYSKLIPQQKFLNHIV
jgi:hypothetical protein